MDPWVCYIVKSGNLYEGSSVLMACLTKAAAREAALDAVADEYDASQWTGPEERQDGSTWWFGPSRQDFVSITRHELRL